MDGVAIVSSSNNTFSSNNISNSDWSGVYFDNSTNNLFKDGVLSLNNQNGTKGEIAFDGASGGIESFLNMSFNASDINFSTTALGVLSVKWYFDLLVNSSILSGVSNSNVTLFDVSETAIFSELTGLTGFIVQKNLAEYTQNISGKNYLTNYTINTTRPSYIPDNRNINITGNLRENITLVLNSLPLVSNINITSDSAKHRTVGNLTGGFSFSDADGHSMIINETKWYNDSIEVTSLANLTSIYYLNTTKTEKWTFSARVYDGYNWSNWQNSTNLTITNTIKARTCG